MIYFYSRIPEVHADAYKFAEYTGSEKDVFLAHEISLTFVDRIDGDYFYRQVVGGEIRYLIKDYVFRKVHKE